MKPIVVIIICHLHDKTLTRFSEKLGYSSATAKSYISGIHSKIKINNLEGRTQPFILIKMILVNQLQLIF